MTPLVYATAIGAALVAGIFYAFSTFVMQALGRLAPRDGIAAMQSINVTVINPLFFVAFFGTGGLCVATVAVSLLSETEMLPVQHSSAASCISAVASGSRWSETYLERETGENKPRTIRRRTTVELLPRPLDPLEPCANRGLAGRGRLFRVRDRDGVGKAATARGTESRPPDAVLQTPRGSRELGFVTAIFARRMIQAAGESVDGPAMLRSVGLEPDESARRDAR